MHRYNMTMRVYPYRRGIHECTMKHNCTAADEVEARRNAILTAQSNGQWVRRFLTIRRRVIK